MKKSELNFKCVCEDQTKQDLLLKVLSEDTAPHFRYYFWRFDGASLEATNVTCKFDAWPEAKMNFDYAIAAIENLEAEDVEPEQMGEWIEFDIRQDGSFMIGTRNYDWQQISKIILNHSGIFGGWLWEDQKNAPFWSTQRFGLNDLKGLSPSANRWVKPIQPIKIRFWRQK